MTKYQYLSSNFFSEIAGIGEIDVNNLAKIEQCNIKVIDYYILLDHLYIYYYYFILAYYYPIPALNKASYTIAMTSSRHRHDIVKTSPLHGDASPKDYRPSPILKEHR